MAILINLTDKNNIINYEGLTLRAKGLYLYMSQLKNGYRFSIDEIALHSKDNQASIYSGFKELENKRFLLRFQIKKRSRIGDVVYVLYPIPYIKKLYIKKLYTEKQYTELQYDDLLYTEKLKAYLLTSTSINNNSISNNKEVSRSSFETKKLLTYWQDNIIKHRLNQKTYLQGKKRLEMKYNHLNRKQLLIKRRGKQKVSSGYKKIMIAIRLYKKLLKSSETIFTNNPPYKISLPIFFSFNSFIKNKYPKQTEGIGSWYAEMCRGEDYCFKKYSKNTIIERMIGRKYPTKDEELLSKVSQKYVEFFNRIKSKLTLPNETDAKYATRFLKYFFKFIDRKFQSRKFRLYIILNKKFLDIEFIEYLQDMDWIK